MLCANGWAVVQCDFQQDQLHDDHEAGLDKEGVAVVCAKPVEDSMSAPVSTCIPRSRLVTLCVLEDRGHEHNERDVEGEAIAAFGAVDREDLVGVGGDRGEYQARRGCQQPLLHLVFEASHNKGAK
jgi:hypothetical protein